MAATSSRALPPPSSLWVPGVRSILASLPVTAPTSLMVSHDPLMMTRAAGAMLSSPSPSPVSAEKVSVEKSPSASPAPTFSSSCCDTAHAEHRVAARTLGRTSRARARQSTLRRVWAPAAWRSSSRYRHRRRPPWARPCRQDECRSCLA